jgi:hypothetical protein
LRFSLTNPLCSNNLGGLGKDSDLSWSEFLLVPVTNSEPSPHQVGQNQHGLQVTRRIAEQNVAKIATGTQTESKTADSDPYLKAGARWMAPHRLSGPNQAFAIFNPGSSRRIPIPGWPSDAGHLHSDGEPRSLDGPYSSTEEGELLSANPSRASPTPSGPEIESPGFRVSGAAFVPVLEDKYRDQAKNRVHIASARRPRLRPLPQVVQRNLSTTRYHPTIAAATDTSMCCTIGGEKLNRHAENTFQDEICLCSGNPQSLQRDNRQQPWQAPKLYNTRPLPLLKVTPVEPSMPSPEPALLPGSVFS